jgi:hypothetical protein
MLGQPEVLAEERPSCGGAESHDHTGLHEFDLLHEPGLAGTNLGRSRLFVQSPPSFDYYELEMLDGVRHVDSAAVDAGLLQRSIEQLAGGADKWVTKPVFLISGLLTQKHDFGGR